MMYIAFLLVFGSTIVVQSKIESIEDVQSLILKTINESAKDFEPCTENLLQKAVFGDLIEIRRRRYFHWSVFIQNATVIQLNNPEFDKLSIQNAFDNFTGQVELRNLIELAGMDFCRINNKMKEAERKGLHIRQNFEILKTMKEELKRNVTFYNIFNHNCEHFATELRFGVSFSSQIEAVKKIVEQKFIESREIVVDMFKMATNAGPTQHHSLAESFLSLVNVLSL